MTKTNEVYTHDCLFTPRWLNKTFKFWVIAARKKGVNPKDIPAFCKFLRNSTNSELNFGEPMVLAFKRWAGEEYEGFVDDVA